MSNFIVTAFRSRKGGKSSQRLAPGCALKRRDGFAYSECDEFVPNEPNEVNKIGSMRRLRVASCVSRKNVNFLSEPTGLELRSDDLEVPAKLSANGSESVRASSRRVGLITEV